jgi:hypothetical protein
MMNQLLIIILTLLTACTQTTSTDTSTSVISADSLPLISTLGQTEKATWSFFQELEAEIKRQEPNFSQNQVNEYIQEMINNGLVNRPEIFIDTKNGTESKTVDYKTYKDFRLNNPIDIKRLWTSSSRLSKEDSLNYIVQEESRKELVKILNTDSVK